MKKALIGCVATLALLCSSCGFSGHATHNTNVAQTNVVLSQRNYRVVRTVEGTSTQNYFFGIGGMSQASMGETAMSEMYRNADLRDGQAVINTSIGYKTKCVLGIYMQSKAIATGTVIQFVEQ